MTPHEVSIACTVIPDGAHLDAKAGKLVLRLSVLLSPVVITTGDPHLSRMGAAAPKVDVAQWGSAVTALFAGKGGLRIHWRGERQPWKQASAKLNSQDAAGFAAHGALAQKTWARAFANGQSNAWGYLHEVLSLESAARTSNARPAEAVKLDARFAFARHAVSPLECVAADTSAIGEFLAAIHTGELARVLDGNAGLKELQDQRETSLRLSRVLNKARLSAGRPDANRVALDQTKGEARRLVERYLAALSALDQGSAPAIATRAAGRRISTTLSVFDSRNSLTSVTALEAAANTMEPLVHQFEWATQFERPRPIEDARAKGSLDNDGQETARRRFNGLQSHPTLAKLVRLVVDVECDLSELVLLNASRNVTATSSVDWFGEFAAEIVADTSVRSQSDAEQLMRTHARMNFRYSEEAGRENELNVLFGPASRYEVVSERKGDTSLLLPLRFGYLDMRQDPLRFRIRTFDTALGLAAADTGSGNREEALSKGAESVSSRIPLLHTQGFEISDSQAAQEATLDIVKGVVLAGSLRDLYAEDLLAGYRVDIERTSGSQAGKWRTATARSVKFQGIPLREGDKHLFPTFQERDDGAVQSLVKLKQTGATPNAQPYARQELFTWTGEPIGLPSQPAEMFDCKLPATTRPQKHKAAAAAKASEGLLGTIDAGKDLNIGVQYGFAETARGILPALRMGDGYRFVLRARYGNGGGPAFKPEAMKSHYNEVALGRSGSPEWAVRAADRVHDAPLPFTTPDPVGAPDLVLLRNDPLVLARVVEAERPQERLDRVVLRWDTTASERVAQRVLIPPRVSFERAEIQKQFDGVKDDVPPGSLRFMRLGADTGVLPQAIDTRVDDAQVDCDGKVVQAGGHRGPVFEAVAIQRRNQPFYCDARARRVVVGVSRLGSGANDHGQGDIASPCEDLHFWDLDQGVDSAIPVVLEFRLSRLGATGARFSGRPVKTSFTSGRRFDAYLLVVEVGLAEKIEVRAWCVDEALVLNNLFMRTIIDTPVTTPSVLDARLAELQDPRRVTATLLKAFAFRPSDILSDVRTFTVTASVRRPLAPPRIVKAGGRPNLRIVRLDPVDPERRWKEMVEDKGRMKDEPGGSRAFIDAQILVHRRSAADLRVQLLWCDFGDDLALERANGYWQHVPRKNSLAETISVHLDEQVVNNPVDVHEEAVAQKKILSFELGNQALRVGVRLVTGSRFKDCYRPAPPPASGSPAPDPSMFETENHPLEAFLKPEYGNQPQDELSMWLPATVRPPVPQVLGVRMMMQSTQVTRTAASVIVETAWSLRIRLRQGTWFQSGEGEMLALVLMPHNLVDTMSVKGRAQRHSLSKMEFELSDELRRMNLMLKQVFDSLPPAPDTPQERAEQALAKLMQAVTGWAADPSTAAGKLQAIMPPSQFSGWKTKRASVPLPFLLSQPGEKGVDKIETAKVAILAYEPQLDAATGERYVDVGLLSPDIDSPFIRLSVARYQPHALTDPQDLSLSSQVTLDPMVVPSPRRTEVTRIAGGNLRVHVTGASYQRRALGILNHPDAAQEAQLQKDEAHMLDVPWMRVAVLRRVAGGLPVQAGDAQGNVMEIEVPALINGNQGIWECEFALPGGADKWRVFIEEFESFTARGADGLGAVERIATPRGFKCDIDIDN